MRGKRSDCMEQWLLFLDVKEAKLFAKDSRLYYNKIKDNIICNITEKVSGRDTLCY